MTTTLRHVSDALTLDLSGVPIRLTPLEFEQVCQGNPDCRLELTRTGELIAMPPTGWITSARNSDLTTQVSNWNRETQLGVVFDSSGGFILPNGAIYSPDVSWVEKSRLEGVTTTGFLPLAPDFVIELRSASDSLPQLQNKMLEYIENGVRLGFLINPQAKQIGVYRLGQPVEWLEAIAHVSGEEVLPGLTLDLKTFW
jgi:Uma2 family endonuclease